MSVLDAIGGTPLLRLVRVTAGIAAEVWLKAEFLNPGGSVKDRAALAMVLAAEQAGDLRPGGTIVEGTSGNTGIGLAMIAAQKGYTAVVVVPDKSSAEKIAALRAYGARVVVTTGGVTRDDPRHVSQVAARITAETPGAWLAGQYDNPANPGAHVATTGPEIWRQTGQRVTHFVAGVGTGGTISGVGKYLRSVGAVTIIGADPASSVYGGGDGSPYYVESIGHYVHPDTVEDVWPQSYHPEHVDRIERIGDRESIEMTRRLAREEGILVGASSGTAVAAALRVAKDLGPDAVVVVLAPDSGRAYLSKYFDDGWLRRSGFPAPPIPGPLVGDAPQAKPEITTINSRVRDVPGGATSGLLLVLPRPKQFTRAAAAGVSRPDSASGAAAIAVESGPDAVTGGPTRAGDVGGSGAGTDAEPRVAAAAEPTSAGDGGFAGAAPAPGDVAGWVPAGALSGAAPDAALTEFAHPALPTVGVGEPVSEALERTPDDVAWLAVLTDGRISGVVSRAALLHTVSEVVSATTP